MLYPYKMTPVFKDYIWGGHNLKRLGKPALKGRVAESWELSAIPGSETKIANGVLKNRSIVDVIKKYGRKKILGDKFTTASMNKGFPLLLKFIDANDRLSIQVHPDNEYAKEIENSLGKTEMWYVIDAKSRATVIHGFAETCKNPVKIRDSILKGKHDGLYREIQVKKGDVVFVPAGTVHALNEGLVVAEIQQNSDLTYRLYDYGRTDSQGNKRPLHINKALDVLSFDNSRALYKGITIHWDNGIESKYLAINEYFCVKEIKSKGGFIELNSKGMFSVFMFLDGEAKIKYSGGKIKVYAMETVFIPAYMGKYMVYGSFLALHIYVPDSALKVYDSLREKGISHEEIIKNAAGAETLKFPLEVVI
ncbi:type I phosphomannose isomerase catalytic subunit [Acetivibrio straminisolvens]|jgi:mannose-6-phosphate isomerase|uniref:type I phosphomannose isomerase catalytic subunit n=1 Tax=Acetivibrio straminisolvens TaxID=253314 RepID=UPI002240D57D|nr:type I phosphomannose isomerase catalytic subunit [Acetivibrio straminisolvens]